MNDSYCQCSTNHLCSYQSLSTCVFDTEGDGAPPVDDEPSSEGIINPDGASSNDSFFISLDNDPVA